MKLWLRFLFCANALRPAFSRYQTFCLFVLALMGICVRTEHAGVTSFVRALGLEPLYYRRLLHLFGSDAWSVEGLTKVWVSWVMTVFGQYKVNGRFVLVADGIKAPREGRKMPAVKSLHQESESNSKPPFIMGHSFQAVALLFRLGNAVWSVPLACRIHEGVVTSNRDRRTLYDKLATLLTEVAAAMSKMTRKYLVADAYYSCEPMMKALLSSGDDLVSRVKSNAVAYRPLEAVGTRGRGRPRKYGSKIKLKDLFADRSKFRRATIAGYGAERVDIEYYAIDLLWKPIGRVVRFILVVYPDRGKCIFVSTDLNLKPVMAIEMYAMRFKIEVSFKQAMRTIGTFAYHFWLKSMPRIKRRSGNQYLHRQSAEYRQLVHKKLESYHKHVMLGLIAQGCMQYLSTYFPTEVYAFAPWLRTKTISGHPSEETVAAALRAALPEFLARIPDAHPLKKIALHLHRDKKVGTVKLAA
jgi:hypothetical protein